MIPMPSRSEFAFVSRYRNGRYWYFAERVDELDSGARRDDAQLRVVYADGDREVRASSDTRRIALAPGLRLEVRGDSGWVAATVREVLGRAVSVRPLEGSSGDLWAARSRLRVEHRNLPAPARLGASPETNAP